MHVKIKAAMFNFVTYDKSREQPTFFTQLFFTQKETRKSKTEAVLQSRFMLKLGVICKFMKRYGKCFMP